MPEHNDSILEAPGSHFEAIVRTQDKVIPREFLLSEAPINNIPVKKNIGPLPKESTFTIDITSSYFEKFVKKHDKIPSKDKVFPANPSASDFNSLSLDPSPTQGYGKSLFQAHQLQPRQLVSNLKSANTEPWIFIVLGLCALFFIGARISYTKRLNQMFQSFFADRFINQLLRDGYMFMERISLSLFINYILMLSLFVYLLISLINPELPLGLTFFLQIVLYIFLFYILKINLIKIIGFVFESEKESAEHILLIHIFNQMGGIFLLPVIFFSFYISKNVSQILVFTCLAACAGVYIFKIFRVLLNSAGKSRFSQFYLFLYLCTLEIIPVLIVAKYLMNNFKAV